MRNEEYQCPYCKTKHLPDHFDKASRNVEYYGSDSFVLNCSKCHKKVRIRLVQCVVLTSVEETQADESF
jgi:DNA-directed RNA polymerase subunit RPC12/RpoP